MSNDARTVKPGQAVTYHNEPKPTRAQRKAQRIGVVENDKSIAIDEIEDAFGEGVNPLTEHALEALARLPAHVLMSLNAWISTGVRKMRGIE